MVSLTHTMLLSASALAGAFAAATPATAGGPEIAYAVESGTRFDLYLANADNTGKKKIYSSTNKTNIFQVDIRRGGNQLAILESGSGKIGVLKIIDYSDSGVAHAPVTVSSPGCTIQAVDYNPADGSLIASRYCNNSAIMEVRRYAQGAWDQDPLTSVDNTNNDHAAGSVRWLGDGSGFLWGTFDDPGGGHIDRYMVSNTSMPVTIYAGANFSSFDVARCATALDAGCSKLLVSDNIGGIHLVSFDDFGGTDQGVIYSNAADGHFSPDNAHVLWRHQVRGGYQLMVDNNVVLKATIAGKDWRQ